jgi:ribosome biogenesis GTPase / thiamine phosphate phosphatase
MAEIALEALGWNEWFASRSGRCRMKDSIGRVAAVDRDQLLLIGKPGFFRAKLSGTYLHESAAGLQRPCVGDWVCVEKSAPDQFGIVHAILDRRTSLRRKAPGDLLEYQMIAANVDFVIVVQSCHYDFNVKRLERYLVMVKDGGAIPLILLTKIDLVAPDVLAAQMNEIRSAGITASVMTVSNVTKEGVDTLMSVLAPGKTYCFVGSSGVGKSTIINALMGRDVLETKAVSGTGEGRHTTVRRELLLLENGAMVIDNPGMREFGVAAAEGGVEAGYSDILALGSQCRFGDCTHTKEPGCAVLEAVESGRIGTDHYENFVKLGKESEHHHMSRVERRKQDKAFGRFIKSVKKDLEDD